MIFIKKLIHKIKTIIKPIKKTEDPALILSANSIMSSPIWTEVPIYQIQSGYKKKNLVFILSLVMMV